MESKPKIKLDEKMLIVLLEALRWSERIKPSQHAKRMVFEKHRVSDRIERVLTAIYYSVLKRQGILDKIIEDITNVRPIYIFDPWLRSALRLAVELMVFRRPSQATKKRLRNVIAGVISSKSHPYIGMYYWRIFEKLEGYTYKPRTAIEELEYHYLLPKWFIEKMIGLLGKNEAEQLFNALNKKMPISVRVNTLKASIFEVVEELTKDVPWVEQSKIVNTVLRFPGPYSFGKSRLWKKGYIVIQEEAAAVASIILNPKPGEVVADLAAAPGGKTEHMAELMNNDGIIYAFDIDGLRIKRMKNLLKRTGIDIVKIYKMDSRKALEVLGEESVDKVLIDAPCTSDGTLAKNPDLRWRIREDAILEFAKLQYEMLEAGWRILRKGGRLLYCTCSMFIEENEDVIKKFINEHENAKLVFLNGPYDPGFLDGTLRTFPHRHGTIGFFYALLEKRQP